MQEQIHIHMHSQTDRHLAGISVCKVLMKHVYPACNPQTYIFLATSVSLNCSFTITAARPRTQRVNLVESILIWRFLRTLQCLMKVSSDPSATCSTALTSVRVHAPLNEDRARHGVSSALSDTCRRGAL